MDEQLSLTGEPEPVVGTPLTHRQAIALSFIVKHGLVSSDELGAMLHADRKARGGRGHDADTRCEWCGDEGAQMGRALRARGLVRRRNGLEGGWYAEGAGAPWAPPHARTDPSTSPFPEGY